MEDFSVKLDCPPGDAIAVAMHKGAVVVAIEMYKCYMASKDALIGTGPELFAEQWIFNFVVFSTHEFDDLILIYFTKILQGTQNG